MSSRKKIYVAFDGDTDIHYYYLMKAWGKNENFDFELEDAHEINYSSDSSQVESIKNQLRIRLDRSRIFILLVGENTKYLRKFVPWEIEYALKNDLPIIIVNLNGQRQRDDNRCPSSLRNELAIHISFNHKIIKHAIDFWPDRHKAFRLQNDITARHFNDETYTQYGL